MKRMPEPEGNFGLAISKVMEMWRLGNHEPQVLEKSWVSASPSAFTAPSPPALLVPKHPRLQGQGPCAICSVSPSLCLSLTFPPALSLCASCPQPGCWELSVDSQVPGQHGLLGMGGVIVLSGVMCKNVGAMGGCKSFFVCSLISFTFFIKYRVLCHLMEPIFISLKM